MDKAQCTLNQKSYNAVEFSKLPLKELSQKRNFLICDECKKPAFFRKAATSGQAACFGARPHASSCSNVSQDTLKISSLGSDEEDIIHNPGQIIEIDIIYGQTEVKPDPSVSNDPTASGRARKYTGNGARPNANMHRRLSTLLKNLVNIEEFKNSTQELIIEGRAPISVASFFVEFKDINDSHEEKFLGYWGLLTDAKINNNTLWLNSGGFNSVSFPVSANEIKKFEGRHKIQNLEDYVGKYALIIGTKATSGKGKEYIKASNIDYITMR